MFRSILVWFFVTIVVIALLIGSIAAVFGFRVATAGLVGRGQAHIQIQGAQNRIAAYDHFFDMCTSIQRNEVALDALLEQRDVFDVGSKEYSKLTTDITGVTVARGGGIARYNNDSAKDYTIGQFKDSDLPYRLSDAPYERGVRTRCVN